MFSQESSLISFTYPRDFGKVIGSRNLSHVIGANHLLFVFEFLVMIDIIIILNI